MSILTLSGLTSTRRTKAVTIALFWSGAWPSSSAIWRPRWINWPCPLLLEASAGLDGIEQFPSAGEEFAKSLDNDVFEVSGGDTTAR